MSETRVVHVNDKVPGAIYIGRANGRKRLKGSPLGNPFVTGRDGDRATVVAMYRRWLLEALPMLPEVGEALIATRGKPVACWCRHDGKPKTDANACHGDVIISVLETYSDDELRQLVERLERSTDAELGAMAGGGS